MQETKKNVEDLRDFTDLARRLQKLKEDPRLEQENPFKNFESTGSDDNTNTVIGDFKTNFIDTSTDITKYLDETPDVTDSAEEITALSQVDIVNNNPLRLDLMKYGNEILRKSAQLARDMATTFDNGKVPEAFHESQTPGMLEYLTDPIISLGSEYVNELQAKIFLWLHYLVGSTLYITTLYIINPLNSVNSYVYRTKDN